MKALRFLRALPLALLMLSAPLRAEQGSIVTPLVGPMTMASYAALANAALLALQTCNSGTSAPANGPSSLAVHYQCWADTTTNPVVFKVNDGAGWVNVGKLNTSTHIWTPVYQGTDLGTASIATTGTSGHTVPFLDGTNTWSNLQTFTSGTVVPNAINYSARNAANSATIGLLGLDGSNNIGIGPSGFSGIVLSYGTLAPSGDNTLSLGGAGNRWANAHILNALVYGSTSGFVTLKAPAVAGSFISTLPAITGTLITADLTKTLTNTTFDTAGTGNSFSINGLAATANTGTGAVVRASSPSLTTPNLGTPSAITLTSGTGLPVSTGISGLASGIAPWLATPSSANLAAALTDETGTGAAVFAGSPTLTGTPAAPTAAVDTNTTQLATTAYVIAQLSAAGDGTPAMDGTAARGSSIHGARADHIHPTDTSRAPLASPTFTGTPTAPTAANGTNTTQIASTAFVQNSISASGGGNVTGPASSVADNVASFNGTTGILIKDSGLSASAIANLFSAWTSYSPSASGSGSFGTGATYTGKYKLIGKTLDFQAVITTGTGTTVTSPIQVTLPLGLVATNTTTISGFNGGSGTNLTAAFVAIGANYATFGTGAALPSSTGFIINGRLEVN